MIPYIQKDSSLHYVPLRMTDLSDGQGEGRTAAPRPFFPLRMPFFKDVIPNEVRNLPNF
ncbi:MAG: hypothetical protein NT092_11870 [Bacteroidia bacterium]|nr:hypothetical protein [Bacteroidia bacterium]